MKLLLEVECPECKWATAREDAICPECKGSRIIEKVVNCLNYKEMGGPQEA